MNNNVHGKCLRMEILLLFAWFWIGFFFRSTQGSVQFQCFFVLLVYCTAYINNSPQ